MLGEGKGKGRFFILVFFFHLHNSTSENTFFCLVSFGDMIGDLRFLIGCQWSTHVCCTRVAWNMHPVRLLVSTSPNQPTNNVFLS